MRRLHVAGFYILLAVATLMTGCSSVPQYKALIPQQAAIPLQTTPHFAGTVEIHSIIKPERMGYDIGDDLPVYVVNDTLETALKESIANSAMFTRVEPKNADYVLDVWVDNIESDQPKWGVGDYGARAFSIWRLTRVRDGKVLVCDFVDGNGLINTMAAAPRTKSLEVALQDVIQNGLRILNDTTMEHLAARPVAGIRPSMGAAVPEGLIAWEEQLKKGWPNLRKGLSLAEVEKIIGPVETSGALERIYQKFKIWRLHRTPENVLVYTVKGDALTLIVKDYEDHILLDKESLTYYDEDMGAALLLYPYLTRGRTFPYYQNHSYVSHDYPPHTIPVFAASPDEKLRSSIIEPGQPTRPVWIKRPDDGIPKDKTVYYMTHRYVLKFYLNEGLQSWELR